MIFGPFRCDTLQKYHQFQSLITQIIVAGKSLVFRSSHGDNIMLTISHVHLLFIVIIVLRTYALYALNLKILAVLAALAVAIICFAIVSMGYYSSTYKMMNLQHLALLVGVSSIFTNRPRTVQFIIPCRMPYADSSRNVRIPIIFPCVRRCWNKLS